MNRTHFLAKSLLIPALLMTTSAFATTYTRRTHFSPRPVGTNLAMEYSTWHDKILKPHKDYIHSHAQITGFYQSSMKSNNLGKYFGIGNGSNSFTVGTGTTKDILGKYLIHSATGGTEVAGKVTFDPKQEVWGTRIDYFQDVNSPVKDLYFKASLPLVYVKNDVHMKISDETKGTIGTAVAQYSLQDFFKGGIDITSDAANKQSPLTKGKINGRRTATGIADIDMALGAKLLDREEYQLFFNLGMTIPTGKKVRSTYLYEPNTGNGQHFAMGFGIDAGVNLWKTDKACLHLLGALNYRYLFQSTEERIMGLKNLNMAHYYLAGKIGQSQQPIFPASNILATPLKVKPGNQFDFLVDLSFKSGGFIIDLGYNAFYKDQESVWVKGWDDSAYGIAAQNYATNSTTVFAAETALTQSIFDLDSVKNPSQFTHKFVGGLGYGCDLAKKWPGTIGLGGSYEFAQDNSAMENYALWIKAGISF